MAYHNYSGLRREGTSTFRKMNRLKDHYTAAQLEELREKRAIVKPGSGMPQPINPRIVPAEPLESLESEESNTGASVDGKKEKSGAAELKGLAAVHAEKRKRAQQRKEREAGAGAAAAAAAAVTTRRSTTSRARGGAAAKESLVVAKNSARAPCSSRAALLRRRRREARHGQLPRPSSSCGATRPCGRST